MTDRQILNRIEKINALEAQKKELEAQLDSLKDEIKADMGELETKTVGNYTIHYTNVESKRFDTTAFKKAYENLYNLYTKATQSRRFSIN